MYGQTACFHWAQGKNTIHTFQSKKEKGKNMKPDNMELLQVKICGKTIVSVEPSKWSGEVRSLMKNQEFVSITLDDGTVLEVGGLYIRDGSHS